MRQEREQQVLRRKQEMDAAATTFFNKKNTGSGSASKINEPSAGSRMTTRQQPAAEESTKIRYTLELNRGYRWSLLGD